MPAEGGINMRMLFSDIKMDPKTSLVNGFKYEPEKFPGLKVVIHIQIHLYCCRLRLWLFFAIASLFCSGCDSFFLAAHSELTQSTSQPRACHVAMVPYA